MSKNLKLLKDLAQQRSAVDWFKGLFKEAHLEVTDTGEKYTLQHQGNRIEVLEGLAGGKPNLIIPVQSENLRWLAGAYSDGKIDGEEEYRIVKYLLQPCLKAALVMPILRNKAIVSLLRVDTHWQEALVHPKGNEDEKVTVVYVNKQWLVVSGWHGKPQRRLLLKPEQFLDFQRRVFKADESGDVAEWVKLTRWYVKWREEITVPV